MEGLAFDVKTTFMVRLFRVDLKGRSADLDQPFGGFPRISAVFRPWSESVE